MRHTSVRLDIPCEFINITPVNPLISRCEIKVCYVGDEPNRNKSIITKTVAEEIAATLPGSPIVGAWDEDTQDFREHDREIVVRNGKWELKDKTRPYGFVDLGARVWFQKFLDDGIYEREYLMTEGWLWTGQYPECQRIIEKGNGQSMELDPKNIDAFWSKDENGSPRFFIINEAIISKLCILGEDYEPCFEGATIEAPKLEFSFDEDFKMKLFSMMNDIKEILEKGGNPMENEVIVELVVEEVPPVEEPAVEEPVIEEPIQDPVIEEPVAAEPVVEEPVAEEPVAEEPIPVVEEPVVEEPVAAYNLEEVVEYQELVANYAALEATHNELVSAHETLAAQVAELTAFKLAVEKERKWAMIDSFYMLSDSDKEDVIANIDTYSLGDIEAKLSIICVRNKVSFDLDDNNNSTGTVYNLNSEPATDVFVPAWIKSAQSVAKKMK